MSLSKLPEIFDKFAVIILKIRPSLIVECLDFFLKETASSLQGPNMSLLTIASFQNGEEVQREISAGQARTILLPFTRDK